MRSMPTLHSLGLKVEDNQLYILDQTMLPHQETWISVKNTDHMVEIIKKLQVRGAPLIGVSAGLALAQSAHRGASLQQLKIEAKLLRESRPTAVNLMIVIDRLITLLNQDVSSDKIISEAENIFNEDVKLCLQMGENGAQLISDGDNILHHCNTGGLATAGIGTALGVIQTAHLQGKRIHVYVDETRPLLQGGRLTCYELEKMKIPYTLICDNMVAHLMSLGKIQKVFVGADRIALNGDFANKIGTQGVATLAHYFNIPFYTVAPYTTIDPDCHDGKDIPIEERKADEVRGASGSFGDVIWSPKHAHVYNPAFDVTPGNIIAGIVLDRGVFTRDQIRNGALKQLFIDKK